MTVPKPITTFGPMTDQVEARPGADASSPFDRIPIEQFRRRFPRARWSDDRQAWFVPGRTASQRFGKWLAELQAEADAHADAKGRDAFEFAPIESAYLELGKAGFRIRTPYSKTIVDKLREVPFSSWDGDRRIWHVPFRSYEDLRRRWAEIEAAARRNEPEERRHRAEERKGTEEERRTRLRSAERRRRRYPLRHGDLPPLRRPVATAAGIIVFTEVTGELVEAEKVLDSIRTRLTRMSGAMAEADISGTCPRVACEVATSERRRVVAANDRGTTSCPSNCKIARREEAVGTVG